MQAPQLMRVDACTGYFHAAAALHRDIQQSVRSAADWLTSQEMPKPSRNKQSLARPRSSLLPTAQRYRTDTKYSVGFAASQCRLVQERHARYRTLYLRPIRRKTDLRGTWTLDSDAVASALLESSSASEKSLQSRVQHVLFARVNEHGRGRGSCEQPVSLERSISGSQRENQIVSPEDPSSDVA